MQKKTTKTQSIHLRLNKDLVKEIDIFTKEYKFTNRTDAIRFLIAHGMKYIEITDNLLKKKIADIDKHDPSL